MKDTDSNSNLMPMFQMLFQGTLIIKLNKTAKLEHGLYHDATVVNYNLFIKFFNIGNVKYPAHAR